MIGFAACDECDGEIRLDLPVDDLEQPCPRCETVLTLEHSGEDKLTDCPVCGEQDFYRNSQINPSFGIFMVASCFFGFLAFVFFMPGMNGFLLGSAVLLTGAVLDRLLRLVLPEAAVCYHCKSVYSDVPNIDEFEFHDQEKRAEIEMGSAPH